MTEDRAKGFVSRVRLAATGNDSSPVVLLGNIEVEREWALGENGVPRVGDTAPSPMVARMDELTLLLGEAADRAVVKAAPDRAYLDYLTGLGLDLPQIEATDQCGPTVPVTHEALASPRLLERLRTVGASGAQLLPHGISEAEEDLCRRAGLTPATPPAAVAKKVNSKIYGRRIAAELGIAQADGVECESVAEFEAAMDKAAGLINDGHTVGVKDAYGVSGKGIVITDQVRRLEQLSRMIRRRAERTGDDRLAVVVETWLETSMDLNYHFTIIKQAGEPGGGGGHEIVRFDYVKEARTEGGVHKSHRMPARLTPEQTAEIEDAAQRIGRRLGADGYFGPVGVDAIVRPDGSVLPAVDVNARLNLSSYHARVLERCVPPGAVVVARHFDMSLLSPIEFDRLADALADTLYSRDAGRGALINTFATLNAGFEGPPAPPPALSRGRLYLLLIAADQAEVDNLDATVTDRVAEFGGLT